MESKKKKAENNLTKGSVIRVLFTFSVPFIIANIIQALYGAVDLLVIGRYCGPESVGSGFHRNPGYPDHHQPDYGSDSGKHDIG